MLLLLHPLGLDRGTWRWMDLPGSVAIDLPGHGAAPWPDPRPTLGDLADLVARSCAEPADVVGISMGGMVAQHLAARHPDLVRSLVLVATSAVADRATMLDRAVRAERSEMADMVPGTLQRWFSPAFLDADPPPVRYARESLLRFAPRVFGAVWRTMAEHDLATLGELRVPVTVVAGREDAAGSVDARRRLADALTRSRLRVIEGPHMLQLERPNELEREIRDHLEWVRAGAAA